MQWLIQFIIHTSIGKVQRVRVYFVIDLLLAPPLAKDGDSIMDGTSVKLLELSSGRSKS